MKGNQVRGESYSLQFRLFSCVQDCLDLARKVSLCDLGLNVRTIRIQEGRKRCILVAGETAWGKVESKVRHTVFTANSGVPDLEDFGRCSDKQEDNGSSVFAGSKAGAGSACLYMPGLFHPAQVCL